MEFEWSPRKATANLRKHKVSFKEAVSVFGDPLAAVYQDPDHSVSERRFLIVGTSTSGRLLNVAFADRNALIRIISARKVTNAERKAYEEESQ